MEDSTRLDAFEWLLVDRYHLRGGLLACERAIRAGRFRGDANAGRRRALLAACVALLNAEPRITGRAMIRLAKVYAAMGEADQGGCGNGGDG